MKIVEISINNCLSFGSTGLNESNSLSLEVFNLFVGKNNSGKSNVLKALQLLESILGPVSTNMTLQGLALPQEKFLTNIDDLFFAQDKKRTINFSYTLLIEESDKELVRIIERHPENENVNNPALMLVKLKKNYPKRIKIVGAIEFQTDRAFVKFDSSFVLFFLVRPTHVSGVRSLVWSLFFKLSR